MEIEKLKCRNVTCLLAFVTILARSIHSVCVLCLCQTSSDESLFRYADRQESFLRFYASNLAVRLYLWTASAMPIASHRGAYEVESW